MQDRSIKEPANGIKSSLVWVHRVVVSPNPLLSDRKVELQGGEQRKTREREWGGRGKSPTLSPRRTLQYISLIFIHDSLLTNEELLYYGVMYQMVSDSSGLAART